jgi:branched-chain amino acid transport system ATP-binding protein
MNAVAAPLLAISNLSKAFGGVHAIEGLEMQVQRGAVHSVIGPNGAGKTSLINMLSGVYRPDTGSIRLAGRELFGQPVYAFAAAGIGRTFQNLQVFFNMTVVENVMTGRHRLEACGFVPTLLRTPALARCERRSRARALELLRFLGLSGRADARADALPYGALKRLEIARALAGEPRLLLLDEPAAGLNPTEAGENDNLIRQLAAGGTTDELVEHNMHLVMGVSDRIVVLHHGRLLAEGSPDAVREDPRVVDAYLGAAHETEAAHA